MHKNVVFRNGTVSYTDQGKGRALVLLHGFLASSEIWKPLAGDLARAYRIIAIDLPGHGNSGCFGYAHSMELMAQAVKAVLDSLKLKKYILVGHSLGGYVALAFAEMFPDCVKGMALLHCTAYPDTSDKRDDRNRALNLILRNRNVYTRKAVEELFAPRNRKYMKEDIALARRIARNTPRQGMAAALIGMRDRQGRDIVLGLVDYPVMSVIGGLDTVVPGEHLLEQAALIRHPTVLCLEHAGHMGFLESRRTFLKALRRFLRQCFAPANRIQRA